MPPQVKTDIYALKRIAKSPIFRGVNPGPPPSPGILLYRSVAPWAPSKFSAFLPLRCSHVCYSLRGGVLHTSFGYQIWTAMRRLKVTSSTLSYMLEIGRHVKTSMGHDKDVALLSGFEEWWLSVRLSVCLSVCPSHTGFSAIFWAMNSFRGFQPNDKPFWNWWYIYMYIDLCKVTFLSRPLDVFCDVLFESPY